MKHLIKKHKKLKAESRNDVTGYGCYICGGCTGQCQTNCATTCKGNCHGTCTATCTTSCFGATCQYNVLGQKSL